MRPVCEGMPSTQVSAPLGAVSWAGASAAVTLQKWMPLHSEANTI
jgi:hypothetical protein